MSDTVSEVSEPVIRTFATGATRNLDVNKLDYEGFYSPLAMESFAKYMHTHRLQKDGTLRSADNWQAGIPFDVYMKSMWRHFFDVWKMHRGHKAYSPEDGHELTMEEALNAVAFNVNGYMHELLKAEAEAREDLAAADDECDHCCPVCPLPPDIDASDSTYDGQSTVFTRSFGDGKCDDDDMVSIRIPRTIAILIGVLFVLLFGSFAVLQVLSILLKMQ